MATASIVILLGLAGIYQYAAKFYNDIFYSYLAVGWLAYGVGVFLNTFFRTSEIAPNYSLDIYGLSIISTVPFYLGSFIYVNALSTKRKIFTSLLKCLGWIIGTFLIWYGIIKITLPDLDIRIQNFILVLLETPFLTWTLIRVGRCLRSRLAPDVHSRWAFLLPLTFYLYAALPPLYLLQLVSSLRVVASSLFFYSATVKMMNMIGILSIIRLDLIGLQQRLERRSVLEDIGSLTASIEHDLRSPLGVIDVNINLMKRKLQAYPELLSDLEGIEEQTRRIYAVTNIIPILRGSKEYYEKLMEKTNVGDLVNRSIKAVKVEMNVQNVVFKTEYKTLYAKSYRPMLEQAIVNILRNSVEAIREASRERGLINIILRNDTLLDKAIRVDITDNGCGIHAEDIPDLATLFSTKKDRKANSGIGLFITNRILKVHGGKLEIRSTPGEGTTVSLLLPQWDSRTETAS